jgi:hypothetical protein
MGLAGSEKAAKAAQLAVPESNFMHRYSAKLLFQFRVVVDGDSGKRRLCEERIIVLAAGSAKSALTKAKRAGTKAEYNYLNAQGNAVYFEFVGILDLLRLGDECGPEEVWYDIRERLLPMERRDGLIPPEEQLTAMRYKQ